MFLEDKLNAKWNDPDVKPSTMTSELLNVCVRHISERIMVGMTYHEAFQIIKQTDVIWRSWCKKNLKQWEGPIELFRRYYIIAIWSDEPSAVRYFKMTPEEIEEYGKGGEE